LAKASSLSALQLDTCANHIATASELVAELQATSRCTEGFTMLQQAAVEGAHRCQEVGSQLETAEFELRARADIRAVGGRRVSAREALREAEIDLKGSARGLSELAGLLERAKEAASFAESMQDYVDKEAELQAAQSVDVALEYVRSVELDFGSLVL